MFDGVKETASGMLHLGWHGCKKLCKYHAWRVIWWATHPGMMCMRCLEEMHCQQAKAAIKALLDTGACCYAPS
jgi:hypothetical protein